MCFDSGTIYILLVFLFALFAGSGFSASESTFLQENTAEVQRIGSRRITPELPENVALKYDPANGTVIFLQDQNLSKALEQHQEFREYQSRNDYKEIALTFLDTYHSLFALLHPINEFKVVSIQSDNLDLKHIRLQQVFNGVEVWASQIIVHLDRENHVYLVQGRYLPTPWNVKILPSFKESDAFRVVARELKSPEFKCSNCNARLIIYGFSIPQPRLAYRVLAQPSALAGWEFIIDAQNGEVLGKFSTTYNGSM